MTKTSFREPQKRPRTRRIFNVRNLVILITILIIGGAFAYLGIKYMEAKRDVQRLSNPQEAAKQENKTLIDRIGQLVEVPTDQEPTIATVQDVSKLQGQAFFQNAQNGDKVLIYAQAKKAVLYRPSTDKVIQVAPVNIGDDQQTQEGTSTSDDSSNKSNP